MASQKAELEKAHQEELDAVREKTVAETAEGSQSGLRKQLLSLSKFLCAAAAMRRSGDETSIDSHAFEGVLYQVYGGSQEAVSSMIKLVEGADEKIVSVEGSELDITCKGQLNVATLFYLLTMTSLRRRNGEASLRRLRTNDRRECHRSQSRFGPNFGQCSLH